MQLGVEQQQTAPHRPCIGDHNTKKAENQEDSSVQEKRNPFTFSFFFFFSLLLLFDVDG